MLACVHTCFLCNSLIERSSVILHSMRKLQKNSWHIIQRAKDKRIYVAEGRRTSGAFAVKRRKLSWFGHVCHHDTLPKIILQGPANDSHRRGRPRKSNPGRITSRNGQASLCHYCCTLWMTEVDGQSSLLRYMSDYPMDAYVSRVLVSSLVSP